MSQSGALAVVTSVLALTSIAEAAPGNRPVTVFLERGGQVVDHDGEEVEIPRFGGGDAAWKGIVGCVKTHFAPFQVDIVDVRPNSGDFITAIIGGRASQLGLDDRSTNGVAPYIPNRVQRNARVHVFSKVGTGERDVQNLCAVTVHEVAHAMGLDHTHKCGDIMSYYLDRCGPRKILDVEAPCGEFSARACGTGERTQSSYGMLASLVGLRNQPTPEPQPDDQRDPWAGEDGVEDAPAHDHDDHDEHPEVDEELDDHDEYVDEVEEDLRPRWRGRRNGNRGVQQDGVPQHGQDLQVVEDEDGNRYSVQYVRGRGGRTWVIVRRVR